MNFKDYEGVKIPIREGKLNGISFVPNPTGSDDSVLIQEALNAGSGGKVILPPFTYKASKTIYVPENTTFEGFGLESHIEFTSSNDLDEIPLRTIGTESTIKPFITNERPMGVLKTTGVVIKNIHITGEGVVDSVRLGGIVFIDAQNCHTDMVFVNYVNWSTEHNVNRRGFGLLSVRSNECTFNGGMLDHAGYECFGVYDGSHDIIASNMFIGTGMRCSAQIHQGVHDVLFSDNILKLEDGAEYTNGNLLIHGREGLETTAKDIKITNNIMSYHGTYEIVAGISMIEYAENVEILGNTIKGNYRGIRLGGMCENFDISNNFIDVTGIGISSTSSVLIPDRGSEGFSKIQGNKIFSDGGIFTLLAEDMLITGNYIKGAGYGIRLSNIEGGAFVDSNFINVEGDAFLDFDGTEENILIGENFIS